MLYGISPFNELSFLDRVGGSNLEVGEYFKVELLCAGTRGEGSRRQKNQLRKEKMEPSQAVARIRP